MGSLNIIINSLVGSVGFSKFAKFNLKCNFNLKYTSLSTTSDTIPNFPLFLKR